MTPLLFSDPMRALWAKAERAAATDATILLTGETGVGKGVWARSIHDASPRADRRFDKINMAGMPHELVESELFGHRKGAFTGAIDHKLGLFEQANGGTLLLDEIGDMPVASQGKLLHAIEDRQIRRVGDNLQRPIDVRIIAATHQNLPALIAAGKFRSDLFYRLKVVVIHLPPLRMRQTEIVPLALTFTNNQPLTLEAWSLLTAYTWPGNVRELEHIMHVAVHESGGAAIAPAHLTALHDNNIIEHTDKLDKTLSQHVHAMQLAYIAQALRIKGGDKDAAAKMLGISVATLYRKMGAAQ